MDIPDHRQLGRQLAIFATEPECGSGLPLWLPAGATVRRELERFVTELEQAHGYQHVNTPVMAKRELYERSGHWAHYHEDMYPPMDLGAEQLVLRPMLCPHHILVYDQPPRSVRELPLRIAEVGSMFRYERSGVVGGLSRVRQMTLNDGHGVLSRRMRRRGDLRHAGDGHRGVSLARHPGAEAAALTRRRG